MDDGRKDFLTGFYTRESLVQSINRLKVSYETYKKAFSILLIDIDNFKLFNDKYGHLIGDEVLKYFASSLRLDMIAEQTTLFRFGGDELLVLFHAADSTEAYNLSSRMLTNLKRRPCNIRGHQLKMSFSGGIATYPTDGSTAEELLEKADKALYSSKRNGRAQVTQYHKIWLKKARFIGLAIILLAMAMIAGLGIQLGFQDNVDRGIEKIFTTTVQTKQKADRAWKRLRELQKAILVSLENQVASERIPRHDLISSDFEKRLAQNLEPRLPAEAKPKPAAKTPSKPSPPPPHVIYLKRGGVIRGKVLAQNNDKITIEIASGSGYGTMVLKTEDVEKVEPNK